MFVTIILPYFNAGHHQESSIREWTSSLARWTSHACNSFALVININPFIYVHIFIIWFKCKCWLDWNLVDRMLYEPCVIILEIQVFIPWKHKKHYKNSLDTVKSQNMHVNSKSSMDLRCIWRNSSTIIAKICHSTREGKSLHTNVGWSWGFDQVIG